HGDRPPPGRRINLSNGSYVRTYEHQTVIEQRLNSVDRPTPKNIADKTVHYSTVTLEVSDSMVRTISNMGKATKEFFADSRFVAEAVDFLGPILHIAKTIGIGLAPLYLYQFGKQVYDFVKHDIDLGDFLLNSFESLARCTDSIVTFLQDLTTLGKLPLEILKYLWPFDVIGLVLSTISLISHARGWHRTANFAKEFDKVMDLTKDSSQLTNEEIDNFIKFIRNQDDKKIEKIFEMNKDDLVSRVNKVAAHTISLNNDSARESDRKNAQEEFKDAVKSLRGRVTSKIVSHQLGVTSSAISVVANSILFVTPLLVPAFPGIVAIMPALYTMKGVAGSVSFSNFLFKTLTKYQFDHSNLMKVKVGDLPPIEPEKVVSDKTS
ncbi:MAG: hypothetical protein AAGG81_04255, partial [Chlamydiota bacterium]